MKRTTKRYWKAVFRRQWPVLTVAAIGLVAAVLVVLFKVGPRIAEAIGSGVVLTAIAISLFALAVGHWLGGPDERNRGALALTDAEAGPVPVRRDRVGQHQDNRFAGGKRARARGHTASGLLEL